MNDTLPGRAKRFVYVNAALTVIALVVAALSYRQLGGWDQGGPAPAVLAILGAYMLLSPCLCIGAFVIGYGLEPLEQRMNAGMTVLWLVAAVALLVFVS